MKLHFFKSFSSVSSIFVVSFGLLSAMTLSVAEAVKRSAAKGQEPTRKNNAAFKQKILLKSQKSHKTQQYSQQNTSKSYSGIIARVNGSIITQRDLDEYVRLTEFLSQIHVDPSQRFEFSKEVLREKIHEILEEENVAKIRLIAAGNGQKIDFAPESDVKESYESVAKKMKMTPDQLEQALKKIGVKKSTLIRKIKTDLAWNSYIRSRYNRDVAISDKNAKKAEEEVLAKLNQEAFFVGRIFLPVQSKSDEASVRSHGNNIMNMINRGGSFSNLASQFSKGVEASKGGIIGWVFDGTLSDPEAEALKNMAVGSYKMVRTDRGFSILYLQNKKAPGPQTYTSLRFRQVICPFQNGRPSKEALDQLLNLIADMKKSSKSCNDFIQKAQDSGIMGATEEVSAVLEQMLPEYRKSIGGVESGKIGQPIITDDAVVIICMFEKKKHTVEPPTMEEIKNQKIGEKLMSLSERELRGLIKKASVYTDQKYRLGADYSSSN